MPRKKRFNLRSTRNPTGYKIASSERIDSEGTESSSDFVAKPEKKCKASSKKKVEKILDKRLMYLVSWLGYPKSYDTWEPVENLYSCLTMIDDFEAEREMIPEEAPDDGSPISEDEFLVEKILEKQIEYEVKFQGLAYSNNEWFAEESLGKYSSLIKAFEDLQELAETSEVLPNPLNIGWSAVKIYGAVDEDLFVMEWQWNGQKKVSLVPRLVAKIKYPQVVIAYYESCVGFS